MLISVVIPVYNKEKYITRCVDSILNQGVDEIEIVLVDDGSTDRSAYICDSYSNTRNNIKVIHKENEGLGLTRNRGLIESKGEYVLFVDADDYLVAESLRKLVGYVLESNPDVCYFGWVKETLGTQEAYTEVFPSETPDYKHLAMLCMGEPLKNDKFEIGSACKAIYKRNFLIENDLLFESEREILSEDYIFSAFVCLSQPSIKMLNIPVYCYCNNEGSLTTSYNPGRAEKATTLYTRMKEIVEANELGDEADMRIYNNYIINLLVTFKHIAKANGMSMNEKICEIYRICSDVNIVNCVSSYDKVDTIQLKVLRKLIIHKNSKMIYALMNIRYS